MELNKEVRDRIFTAADTLHEQLGRVRFPTVDDVRKLAKVNMNDASSSMKEWRRAQAAQLAPVVVQVPESVQKAGDQALAILWSAAQEVSTESLRALQVAWDVERAEAETLNRQLADAHESQALELAAALTQVAQLERAGQKQEEALVDAQRKLEDARLAQLEAQNAKTIAEQRADEIQRRTEDLRAELDRAHQDTDRGRTELVAEQARAAVDIQAVEARVVAAVKKAEDADKARQEQTDRFVALQAEKDQALRDTYTAQISAAELKGRVDSLVEQQARLLATTRPLNN